jgi:hypothetical protein
MVLQLGHVSRIYAKLQKIIQTLGRFSVPLFVKGLANKSQTLVVYRINSGLIWNGFCCCFIRAAGDGRGRRGKIYV